MEFGGPARPAQGEDGAQQANLKRAGPKQQYAAGNQDATGGVGEADVEQRDRLQLLSDSPVGVRGLLVL